MRGQGYRVQRFIFEVFGNLQRGHDALDERGHEIFEQETWSFTTRFKKLEDQNQNLRQMKHSHKKQLGFRNDRKNLESMQESNLRNLLGNHQNLKC